MSQRPPLPPVASPVGLEGRLDVARHPQALDAPLRHRPHPGAWGTGSDGGTSCGDVDAVAVGHGLGLHLLGVDLREEEAHTLETAGVEIYHAAHLYRGAGYHVHPLEPGDPSVTPAVSLGVTDNLMI